jgi:hypothetical protein
VSASEPNDALAARVSERPVPLCALLVAFSLLAGATAWYHASQLERAARARLAASLLEPIAALLSDNQALVTEMTSTGSVPDTALLQSYLAAVRRDGVPRHADMKRRLDQITDNDAAIVALIKSYAADARTAAFRLEADKFVAFATTWRDRWSSVMELFMAGGDYATSEVLYPTGFARAVQRETEAAR